MASFGLPYVGGQPLSAQAPSAVAPDEIYRPNPKEAYVPAIYCDWNRTGLPPAQQKICLDRDRANKPKLYQAKPGEILIKLLPDCQVGGAMSCNDDLFQPVWKTVEADNGAVTRIDMNSIQHLSGGTTNVTVYTGIPHTMFDSTKLKMLWFDCQGHLVEFDGAGGQSPQLDAPPRSVAGEIARIVCTTPGPQDQQQARTTQNNANPDYCSDFSADACARIKKGVETDVPPTFCKPGFGLVGSGLTPEQLRICYARAGK